MTQDQTTELKLTFSAIEKAKRRRMWVVAAAALIEGAGLLSYCLLADFSNRTHLLVLIAALLVYGTIAIGIIALGAHVNICTQRILKSIEIASHKQPDKTNDANPQ